MRCLNSHCSRPWVLLCILVAWGALTPLHAQERLVVHLKDGRQQSFPMDEVTHIEFTGRGAGDLGVVGTWTQGHAVRGTRR